MNAVIISDDTGVLRVMLQNFRAAVKSPALCRRILGKQIRDERVNVVCHELIYSDGDWDKAKEALRGKKSVGKKFVAFCDSLKGGAL